VRVLRHPAFLAGDTTTAFFDTHGLDRLSKPLVSAENEALSIVAAALADSAANRRAARTGAGLPSGWRNLPSHPQTKSYHSSTTGTHDIRYRLTRCGLDVEGHDGLELVEAEPDHATQVAPGSLLAPMPGTVIRLGAEVGGRVHAGRPVMWLEAMKMEHTIAAPATGLLTELNVTVGDQVDVGAVLAVVETDDPVHPTNPNNEENA
jgi:propionyl-CoA carboxylase alpha chain